MSSSALRTDAQATAPSPLDTQAAQAVLVAVEATRLAREVRGIGRYVRALIPRLLEQRPELRLALFVKNDEQAGEVSQMFAHLPSLRRRIEVRDVSEMSRMDADVYWYPWNVASPVPAKGAVVVTMHDVAPLALPDPRLRKWRKNFRWRLRYRATAKRATIIIADSAFTAHEVNRMLGVPHDRMRVALLAADDFTAPPASRDEAALERLGVTRPFVLAVGAADRRKNLALLSRAMPSVVERFPETTLVLAGPRSTDKVSQPNAPWVNTLGFVSEEDLATLYRSAEVLVVPSIYEGFGLPLLEAMQLGTPVIASHASSLPEVGGTAAEWVDPNDDRQLAALISRVLSDDHHRQQLRVASVAQARRFSWNETARLTLSAFDDGLRLARARF